MNEENALATIFANTKRRKRNVDLLTVAESFQFLKSIYGSQEEVAKKTDLSREMVREFLQILNLPDYVKILIKNRQIDRIDIAYRLSKVKNEETLRAIVDRMINLQTHDLRDVISTAGEAGLSVDSAKEAVLKAKPRNLHVFIIDFEEKNYSRLLLTAKKEGCSPADIIKTIMDTWLDAHEGGARY